MRIVGMVLVGALYGVALRTWMRFVSTEPEFSWSGTGYILGIFTVLGLMAGLCDLGRRRGWIGKLVGVRIVGGVLALGCFMAAGLAMFPTIVPAALGLARTDWPKMLRFTLGVFAAGVAGYVVLGLEDLSLGRRLIALALYAGLCVVEVMLLARILAPSLAPGTIRLASMTTRVLIIGLPLMAVFALVIATVGISTG